MPSLRRPELYAALNRSPLRTAAGTTLLLCTLAAPAFAQQSTEGGVHGVVLDGNRRPVAGVALDLSAPDGSHLRASTGPDGSFLMLHLLPGEYVFGTSSGDPAQTLVVSAGDVTELRIQMLPDHLSGSVAARLQSLPAEDAVAAPPEPDQDEDGLASLHGVSALQQTESLDGAETTQQYHSVPAGAGSDPAPDPDGNADDAERSTGPAHGLGRGRHAGIAYLFAQSSVREFRVAGLGYSAQTAHAGAVSTIISRSGTAEFHGSALYAVRSQLFAAANPLAIASTYEDGVITRTLASRTISAKPSEPRSAAPFRACPRCASSIALKASSAGSRPSHPRQTPTSTRFPPPNEPCSPTEASPLLPSTPGLTTFVAHWQRPAQLPRDAALRPPGLETRPCARVPAHPLDIACRPPRCSCCCPRPRQPGQRLGQPGRGRPPRFHASLSQGRQRGALRPGPGPAVRNAADAASR